VKRILEASIVNQKRIRLDRATIRILLVVGGGWFVCLAVAAAVCRSLYGDGAWLVLSQLAYPFHYNDYDFHRSFASYLAQTPLLLGERFGLPNVTAYAALYTLGSQALPAASLFLALFLATSLPGLFVATIAAIVLFGFGVNFVNSEVNLFFALAWLCAVIVALPGPRPVLRCFVLPMLAFALLRVYEGMLFAGPVLALGSFLAARTSRVDENIGLTIATMLFTIGALIGFSSFVAPRDPGNASNFLATSFAYLENPQAFALASVLAAGAAMRSAMRGTRIAWIAASIVFAAWFVWLMIDLNGYYAYRLYYANRAFLIFLLTFAIGILMLVTHRRPTWLAMPVPRFGMAVVMIPFVAVVVVDLLGSARWMAYMRSFCTALDDPAAIALGTKGLEQTGALTGWVWTHPTLSVLLRRHGSDAMVLNGHVRWQPFDPSRPLKLQYRGACENRRFASSR